MESRPLPIVVDDRELRSPVFGLLESCDQFEVKTRRLPLGDYLIDNWLLVERKTLPDLVASLRDARLFSQAVRLVNSGLPRVALLLEGTAIELAHSRMRREALQGALLHLGLFLGLPVLRSRSPDETVRLFLYAARQRRTVATGSLPRANRRPKSKAALQRYILQGLPGIGPDRARRLLAHFGTVEAVVTANTDELTAVAGIGIGIARAIHGAVRESPARYNA